MTAEGFRLMHWPISKFFLLPYPMGSLEDVDLTKVAVLPAGDCVFGFYDAM